MEQAAAPLVSWTNQLCLLRMKPNVLIRNAPKMLQAASQLTWLFYWNGGDGVFVCVRSSNNKLFLHPIFLDFLKVLLKQNFCIRDFFFHDDQHIQNYKSEQKFQIWKFHFSNTLICPWEKPRKLMFLKFYIALFYCLLVFSLNDCRGSVPNDESLGLENLVFLSSSPTLTRSWRCPGLLLCYLPLMLLYSFYFHHPHHLSVELVQGSLLFSFVPNQIQMDKSINHKQWLCHWRSSLYTIILIYLSILMEQL